MFEIQLCSLFDVNSTHLCVKSIDLYHGDRPEIEKNQSGTMFAGSCNTMTYTN